MHLIEKYSLNCGISPKKLKQPYIYTSYYPIGTEKYLVIHPSSGMQSKNYSYYQDIVDFIYDEVTAQGYSIVQIGEAKDQNLSKCINLQGKTNIHQTCYILKNASMFIGNDSFSTHVCSSYRVPSVSLYSVIQPEVSGPYWNNGRQFTIMSPLSTKKPKYSNEDPDKDINKIKPEQILEKIKLALPGLLSKNSYNFDSIFFGKSYPNVSIEIIPDSEHIFNLAPELVANIRFDYLKDKNITNKNIESCLANLLNRRCGIITHRPININVLKNELIKTNMFF